jgi:hypothetical protein
MNVVAGQFEKSPQQVPEQERAEVANMSKVVDGGAATVHPNLTGLARSEFLKLVRQRVIKLNVHIARKFKKLLRKVGNVQGIWRKIQDESQTGNSTASIEEIASTRWKTNN